LTGGSRQQEVAQVFSKNINRFCLGVFPQSLTQLGFKAGVQFYNPALSNCLK